MNETTAYRKALHAAKKGAALLDENHPGWVDEIDLDTLDMSSCQKCVIGQVLGDYDKVGTMVPDINYRPDYGFTILGGHGYTYRELDQAWTEIIASRRGFSNKPKAAVRNHYGSCIKTVQVVADNAGLNLDLNQLLALTDALIEAGANFAED